MHRPGGCCASSILTGRVSVVARGLDSPVGLAVSDEGDVYVSELRAGRVSRCARHRPRRAVPADDLPR